MNSPPNYEWKQLLDIDDSDLPLTPVLRPYSSHTRETTTTTTTKKHDVDNLEEKPVRIIPSPAEYIKKVVEDVGEDEDFKSRSWVSVTEYVNANNGILSGCLGDIKNFLKNRKLEQAVAIIQSCTSKALGDLTVTMKDLLVFFPKSSMHYLNIIMRKVVDVFYKDSVLGNGSGVEDLYRFDEEALNLTLEEEVRQARADREWLEKCRFGHSYFLDFFFLVAEGGEVVGSSGALKPSTNPVIDIFMYPLGAEVEETCASEVKAVGAMDVVGVPLNILISSSVLWDAYGPIGPICTARHGGTTFTDYTPGPEAPPSPDYTPGPEYPKYLPPADDMLPVEEQPVPAVEEEEHLAPTVLAPALYSSISTSEETEPFEEVSPTSYPLPPFVMPLPIFTPLPTSSFPLPSSIQSTSGSESIPEVDIPLRKRARFTTPTSRYEIGESSIAVAAARQIRPTLTIADKRRADDKLIGRLRRERRYFRTLATTYAQEDAHSCDYCTRIMDYCQSREKMAPKRARTTRANPDPTKTTTATEPMSQEAINNLIAQRVAKAIAEYETQRNNVVNGDTSNTTGTGPRTVRPTLECTYKDYLNCGPLKFNGTEGVIGLIRWFERTESVFSISNCTSETQVKFASCTLIGSALTWWNSHMRAVSQEVAYAMPWRTLKQMMTTKYCPRGEIKKLEVELWNLKVKGTDITSYTLRFQELTLLCGRMFPEELDEIERYWRTP
nr:hypothetical protein [Tanacetum cinerariifolium]